MQLTMLLLLLLLLLLLANDSCICRQRLKAAIAFDGSNKHALHDPMQFRN